MTGLINHQLIAEVRHALKGETVDNKKFILRYELEAIEGRNPDCVERVRVALKGECPYWQNYALQVVIQELSESDPEITDPGHSFQQSEAHEDVCFALMNESVAMKEFILREELEKLEIKHPNCVERVRFALRGEKLYWKHYALHKVQKEVLEVLDPASAKENCPGDHHHEVIDLLMPSSVPAVNDPFQIFYDCAELRDSSFIGEFRPDDKAKEINSQHEGTQDGQGQSTRLERLMQSRESKMIKVDLLEKEHAHAEKALAYAKKDLDETDNKIHLLQGLEQAKHNAIQALNEFWGRDAGM